MSVQEIKQDANQLAKLHAKAVRSGDKDDFHEFCSGLMLAITGKEPESSTDTLISLGGSNASEHVKSNDSVIVLGDAKRVVKMNAFVVTSDDDSVFQVIRENGEPCYQDGNFFDEYAVGIHVIGVRNQNGLIRQIWLSLPNLEGKFIAVSLPKTAKDSATHFFDLINSTFAYSPSWMYSELSSFFRNFEG